MWRHCLTFGLSDCFIWCLSVDMQSAVLILAHHVLLNLPFLFAGCLRMQDGSACDGVCAQGQEVKGRVLIIADGATSKLATHMGYCTEPPKGICSRAYVEGGTHNTKFDGAPHGILHASADVICTRSAHLHQTMAMECHVCQLDGVQCL